MGSEMCIRDRVISVPVNSVKLWWVIPVPIEYVLVGGNTRDQQKKNNEDRKNPRKLRNIQENHASFQSPSYLRSFCTLLATADGMLTLEKLGMIIRRTQATAPTKTTRTCKLSEPKSQDGPSAHFLP